MPLSKKPCKHCEEPSPNHWPYQCKQNPKKPKKIKQRGKHAKQWEETRDQWFKDNPGDSYNCYLCGKYLPKNEVTLDHVIPRSRAPGKRYDQNNLKPCCWSCNGKKGSKVYN